MKTIDNEIKNSAEKEFNKANLKFVIYQIAVELNKEYVLSMYNTYAFPMTMCWCRLAGI